MINKCPYCNSKRINKNGHKCNKQRYICRNCSKSFCELDARVKRPLEQRKLCLILYSLGLSKNSIKETIERQYNTKISYSLVEKWIKAGIKALKFDVDNRINNNITEEEKENKKEKEDNKIKENKKEKEDNKIKENKKEKEDNIINILEMDENKCIRDVSLLNITDTEVCQRNYIHNILI